MSLLGYTNTDKCATECSGSWTPKEFILRIWLMCAIGSSWFLLSGNRVGFCPNRQSPEMRHTSRSSVFVEDPSVQKKMLQRCGCYIQYPFFTKIDEFALKFFCEGFSNKSCSKRLLVIFTKIKEVDINVKEWASLFLAIQRVQHS